MRDVDFPLLTGPRHPAKYCAAYDPSSFVHRQVLARARCPAAPRPRAHPRPAPIPAPRPSRAHSASAHWGLLKEPELGGKAHRGGASACGTARARATSRVIWPRPGFTAPAVGPGSAGDGGPEVVLGRFSSALLHGGGGTHGCTPECSHLSLDGDESGGRASAGLGGLCGGVSRGAPGSSAAGLRTRVRSPRLPFGRAPGADLRASLPAWSPRGALQATFLSGVLSRKRFSG
ncbi:translation initiation factor IF-2-like [Cebus imitator]|uniref:translation initiation factor IF-2-like n=1 Tax=Cebus imitator TaxID=2715852 RepID=UPI001896D33D|nr:translation initiation factor IF-2-like [Cebus imitator]